MQAEAVSHDFGLSQGTQAKMNAVFARYPQINQVMLYGSRTPREICVFFVRPAKKC